MAKYFDDLGILIHSLNISRKDPNYLVNANLTVISEHSDRKRAIIEYIEKSFPDDIVKSFNCMRVTLTCSFGDEVAKYPFYSKGVDSASTIADHIAPECNAFAVEISSKYNGHLQCKVCFFYIL